MTKPVFPVGKVISVIAFVARGSKLSMGSHKPGYNKGETLTAVVIKTEITKWSVRIINNDGLDVHGIANRSWTYAQARTKALLLASDI